MSDTGHFELWNFNFNFSILNYKFQTFTFVYSSNVCLRYVNVLCANILGAKQHFCWVGTAEGQHQPKVGKKKKTHEVGLFFLVPASFLMLHQEVG